MILLKDVSIRYDDLLVLKNCSLKFEANEVHLIIGPTAAGKTTLALVIANLIKPNTGMIVFPRGNMKGIRKEMGFLFQFPEDLFFNDTVFEEIAYGARKHHLKHIDEAVLRVLEMVGLSKEILSRAPFTLSESEKRLVALASIIVWNPSWLILDEPFSGLDWQARNRIVKIIERLKGEVGIILIAHHLNDIIEYVDQITLIVDGEIIFSSPLNEVDWDVVYNAGCDIPYAIKVSKKLRENGIKVSLEYTIPGLVEALKK